MMKSVIHIIDDEIEVRESSKFLVEQLGYEQIQLWENGADFIENANLYEQAIAIVDLRMPKMDGQEVIYKLKELKIPIAPIILTGHGDIAIAVKMLQEGAVDFLEKPVSMQKLIDALEKAERESTIRMKGMALKERFNRLSEREQEVSQLVYSGLTNKEIAQQLNIAIRTVEVQRSNAMRKMNARNLVDFIADLTYLEQLLRRYEK